jgi:hypothetical protein
VFTGAARLGDDRVELADANTDRLGGTFAALGVLQGCQHARFRALRDHRGRFHPPRDDPPHAAPIDQINPLSMNPNFLDRL